MPAIQLQEFVCEPYAHSSEYARVSSIAHQLRDHLNAPEAQAKIAAADQPGRSSAEVQATFSEFARSLGFRSEARGPFARHRVSGLRPDYYLALERIYQQVAQALQYEAADRLDALLEGARTPDSGAPRGHCYTEPLVP